METHEFELIVSFDGDGNLQIIASTIITETLSRLVASVIKPFVSDPEVKNRLINNSESLLISVTFKEKLLHGYYVGFTNRTTIQNSVKYSESKSI